MGKSNRLSGSPLDQDWYKQEVMRPSTETSYCSSVAFLLVSECPHSSDLKHLRRASNNPFLVVWVMSEDGPGSGGSWEEHGSHRSAADPSHHPCYEMTSPKGSSPRGSGSEGTSAC